MSPESEDSFSVAAGDSPGSHHSFNINTMPLAEGLDDLVMDVPPLPEDQDIDMGQIYHQRMNQAHLKANTALASIQCPFQNLKMIMFCWQCTHQESSIRA
jgi:hypothetical protein